MLNDKNIQSSPLDDLSQQSQKNSDEQHEKMKRKYCQIQQMLRQGLKQTQNHYTNMHRSQFRTSKLSYNQKKSLIKISTPLYSSIQSSPTFKNSEKHFVRRMAHNLSVSNNNNRINRKNSANIDSQNNIQKEIIKLHKMGNGIQQFDRKKKKPANFSSFNYCENFVKQKEIPDKNEENNKTTILQYPELQIKQIQEKRMNIISQIQEQKAIRKVESSQNLVVYNDKQNKTNNEDQKKSFISSKKQAGLFSNLWKIPKISKMKQMQRICCQMKKSQTYLNNYIKQFKEYINPITPNFTKNQFKSQRKKETKLCKKSLRNSITEQKSSIPLQFLKTLGNKNKSRSETSRLFRKKPDHQLIKKQGCLTPSATTREFWKSQNRFKICVKVKKIQEERLERRAENGFNIVLPYSHRSSRHQGFLQSPRNLQQIIKYF